jgi:hypothetical protein
MSSNSNLIPFDPSAGLRDKRVPIIDVAKGIVKRIGAKIAKTFTTDPKDVLKFAWVAADKIYINYARQRWPEPKHMKKLFENWNIFCVTPLQCRYDPVEDRYYGTDGQQHMTVWLIKYGFLTEVPCFYVESTDENIESIQLVELNTASEPMAKYFIHKQKIMMGDKKSIALEKAVTDANCETAYKKRQPGCITHISHLIEASESYGNGPLTLVLSKMLQFWPTEKIAEPTMLGFLKVREILIDQNVFSDSLFNDIFYEASLYSNGAKDLHIAINHQFQAEYPTNYKGMGVREKVACGIIDLYEQAKGRKLCDKVFDITMPIMPHQVATDDSEDEE